jgi:hypothetical protein
VDVHPDEIVVCDDKRVRTGLFFCIEVLPANSAFEDTSRLRPSTLAVETQVPDVLAKSAAKARKAGSIVIRTLAAKPELAFPGSDFRNRMCN